MSVSGRVDEERVREIEAAVGTGDDSPGALARCLRKARAHQGHTLRAVEAATGVHNAHLSQIERGLITKPTLEALIPLASFLNLDLALLVEWAGYSPVLVALVRDAALVRSLEREAAEREKALRDCLSYFEQFDRERTDGRTSPIIAQIAAALSVEPTGDAEGR